MNGCSKMRKVALEAKHNLGGMSMFKKSQMDYMKRLEEEVMGLLHPPKQQGKEHSRSGEDRNKEENEMGADKKGREGTSGRSAEGRGDEDDKKDREDTGENRGMGESTGGNPREDGRSGEREEREGRGQREEENKGRGDMGGEHEETVGGHNSKSPPDEDKGRQGMQMPAGKYNVYCYRLSAVLFSIFCRRLLIILVPGGLMFAVGLYNVPRKIKRILSY